MAREIPEHHTVDEIRFRRAAETLRETRTIAIARVNWVVKGFGCRIGTFPESVFLERALTNNIEKGLALFLTNNL